MRSPNATGQLRSCEPYPATRSTVGSVAAPKVSYSSVSPLAIPTAVMRASVLVLSRPDGEGAARSPRTQDSGAGRGSHGSVLRRAAVDHEREDVLDDRLAGGL